MSDLLAALAASLIVPTILFFVLGLVAALVRSDLSVPAGAAKFMSLYLLLSIGFKGGASLAQHGLGLQALAVLGAGVGLSFLLPILAFWLLGRMTRLDRVTAAAVAGHYGSISIVTFVTAVSLAETAGLKTDGYLVAVAAAMEVPAILSALWLAGRSGTGAAPLGARQGGAGQGRAGLWRDLLANGSVLLLLGALAIGALTGQKGMSMLAPFIVTPFAGILCLFLLDMGLVAGQGLMKNRHRLSPGLFAFGVVMPVISALLAAGLGVVIGLETGNLFVFLTLAASASYIAVPAAMRIALPQAEPGIYLTLALGVTFPFNIALGLPVYLWLAGQLA